MKKALLAPCLGALFAVPLHASPKVSVTMPREAFATWKLGTAVAAPGQGDCAQQVVDKTLQMLQKHNVVAGPVNLPSVLMEHGVKLPTFLKAGDVAALGKHVDADTLFLIRISQCTYPSSTFNFGHPVGWLGVEDTSKWIYTTTTRATVSGTLQLLDLKTGKILKPLALEATPEFTNTSETAYVDAVPADKVQARAFEQIVSQVEILFFPWTEQRDMVFYDDKDCDLKQAFGLMKSGDVKSALEASQRSSDECKANPKRGEKERRKAIHNLATVRYATGDYEGAQQLFEEALRLGGGEDQKRGIQYCKWKLELREAARQLDSQVAAASIVPY
jgi:hypothetical protein